MRGVRLVTCVAQPASSAKSKNGNVFFNMPVERRKNYGRVASGNWGEKAPNIQPSKLRRNFRYQAPNYGERAFGVESLVFLWSLDAWSLDLTHGTTSAA